MGKKKKKNKLASFITEFHNKHFRKFWRKLIGYDEIQEQIDTLYYIVNNGIDIKKFPKATGCLRQTQLVDTEILRLVHEVLEKYDFTYWLDWGTLLGAVRHEGFIPWDDDLDICMSRDEINRVYEILQKELEPLGFEVGNYLPKRITVTKWKAGAICDIFAMDCCSVKENETKEIVFKNKIKYRKAYQKDTAKSEDELRSLRIKYWGRASEDPKGNWYLHGTEFSSNKAVYSYDDIYPIKKIKFEDYELCVPNNTDAYLTACYNRDYMDFPRNGMLHHNGGSDKIYMNCVKNKIDMDALITNLRETHI